MKTNKSILAAAVYGTKAFKDGKDRIPALDAEFMNFLEGCPVGVGARLIKEYLKAWDLANLNSTPTN